MGRSQQHTVVRADSSFESLVRGQAVPIRPEPAVTAGNARSRPLPPDGYGRTGALYRYWRQGQTGGRLALVLIAGTLTGVIAGSVIRVGLLPVRAFDLVVAAVLLPLGT
jgi:uncharacterized protein